MLLQVGQCFTVLSRPEGSLASGKIANVLKFRVKEIDPTTGEAEEDGYEDEYQVHAGYMLDWCCMSCMFPCIVCWPALPTWLLTCELQAVCRELCRMQACRVMRAGMVVTA